MRATLRRQHPGGWALALVLGWACASACKPATEQGRSAAVELWLGGDVHMGDDKARAFLDPELDRALAGSIGIINLEGPVGTGTSTAERLANAPASLVRLARHGVAVASIVNNHALDQGSEGQVRTQETLRELGILAAGSRHVLIEREGLRIAVTAHDLSPDRPGVRGLARPSASQDARTRWQARQREITQAIDTARQDADFVVAVFHVTGPPSYLPGPELEAAVDTALDAGAIIIAAHGSHALARVERRGPAIIAWGLGNLVFSCPCTDERDGLIVRVRLTARGIDSAAVIPIDAGLGNQAARLATNPGLTMDLLESLGTTTLSRAGNQAFF